MTIAKNTVAKINKKLFDQSLRIMEVSNFSQRQVAIAMGYSPSAVSLMLATPPEEQVHKKVYHFYESVCGMQERQFNEIKLMIKDRETKTRGEK
jgi:DNA transposition AAA+ family ATPase